MRTVLFWDHSWDLISLETLHFSDHLLEILVGNLLLLFLKATIDLGDPSQCDAGPLVVGEDLRNGLLLWGGQAT